MLSQIIGHEPIKAKLSLFLSGDPEGTYLFCGPPNVGKRTIAFEAAKILLCENKKGEDCTCKSCHKFNNNHPDFLCIGWKDKIKVADIDNLINFSYLVPFLSNKKVVIIDNIEDISWEVSNRLLKILEEPPEKFIFFLITSNPQALVSTVLNRCLKFEFGTLSKKELTDIIVNKLGFEPLQAKILSSIAAESSIDIFAKAGHYIRYRDMAFEFISNLKHKNLIDLLDYVDKIERIDIPIFADMILLLFTDILLLYNGVSEIINEDLLKGLTKLSKHFNDRALIGIINIFSQIKKDVKLNVNMSLIFKNALIKAYPFAIVEIKNETK